MMLGIAIRNRKKNPSYHIASDGNVGDTSAVTYHGKLIQPDGTDHND